MLTEIASVLGIAKTALNIGKDAKDLLPDGKDKDYIDKQIQLTEREIKLAEASVANDLEYDLCKCTFPPQIMLYDKNERATICPNCQHEISKKLTVEVFSTAPSKWDNLF